MIVVKRSYQSLEQTKVEMRGNPIPVRSLSVKVEYNGSVSPSERLDIKIAAWFFFPFTHLHTVSPHVHPPTHTHTH